MMQLVMQMKVYKRQIKDIDKLLILTDKLISTILIQQLSRCTCVHACVKNKVRHSGHKQSQ